MSDTLEITMNLVRKAQLDGSPASEELVLNTIIPIITVPGESGFDVDLALLYQIAKS